MINTLYQFMVLLPVAVLSTLAFPVKGWGATYYVDSSVTDTHVAGGIPDFMTYDPETFSTTGGVDPVFKTCADIGAHVWSGGDIIKFRRGQTWGERLKTYYAGVTFTAFGMGAPPVFTGDGMYSGEGRTNQVFEGLWFKNSQFFAGQSGVIMKYCIFSDTPETDWGGVYVDVAGSVSIYNSLFLNHKTAGITVFGGNTATAKNNIFLGAGGVYGPLYSRNNGAVSYGNNLFGGGTYNPASSGLSLSCTGTNCTDLGGNIYITEQNTGPRFVSYRYPVPQVSIQYDDDVNHYIDMMSVLGNYGVKGTLFPVYGFVPFSQAQKASLQALIDSGHEVGCHGGSHNSLILTKAFKISTTNSGTNRLTIDGTTNKRLKLESTGNPWNNVTIDWSSAPKTYIDLVNAISGKGWSITDIHITESLLRLSSLMDTSCSSFPCQAELDITGQSRFYEDEMINACTSISEDLGRPVTSFAYGFGDWNTGVIDYLRNNTSLKGARGTSSGALSYYLDSMNVYAVHGLSSWNLKTDGSETSIRSAARALHGWARGTGGVIVIYQHNLPVDLTLQEMEWLVDEFNQLGVEWGTFSQQLDWIKSDHTTVDGITYTKTYAQGDYHLNFDSPAIDVGEWVDLPSDIEGNPVVGLPDIGPYEDQGASPVPALGLWGILLLTGALAITGMRRVNKSKRNSCESHNAELTGKGEQ
ncbi:MAG: hypothetical protein C4581_00010 [Nitrospiraceae bacterium]|nr:MAG: hypothetical protein C4581_00010 [Nitrospiraceae bacterium]